jgi:hypothetical protein
MGKNTAKWFVASAVVVAIAVGLYAWLEQDRSRPADLRHAMTADEQAYLSEVQVSGERMSTASNFLGNNLYYLDAHLSNKGPKAVRDLDLNLAFTDPFGDVVYRLTERAVTPQTPPLTPGQTRPVHFIFEHLPAEWNEGPPRVVVSYLAF